MVFVIMVNSNTPFMNDILVVVIPNYYQYVRLHGKSDVKIWCNSTRREILISPIYILFEKESYEF